MALLLLVHARVTHRSNAVEDRFDEAPLDGGRAACHCLTQAICHFRVLILVVGVVRT